VRELEAGNAEELGADEPVEAEDSIETEYETVLTQDALDAWLEKLKAAGEFAFDTETTSLNYMEAKLVGVSFG
jgi:DNA polymerase I - 3''-5'' exonuclease and polymerase domains